MIPPRPRKKAKLKNMTIEEGRDILVRFNEWRREDGEALTMPDPKEVGKAIDMAVSVMNMIIDAAD